MYTICTFSCFYHKLFGHDYEEITKLRVRYSYNHKSNHAKADLSDSSRLLSCVMLIISKIIFK